MFPALACKDPDVCEENLSGVTNWCLFVPPPAGVVNTKPPAVTVAAVTISLAGIRTHWEVLANTG